MNRLTLVVLAALALILFGMNVVAAEGSGSVKVGFTSVDEEGNLSVDQSSYNLYEGLGLSLSDWNYAFDNGVGLHADFQNLTLNNRVMDLQLGKPGLFKFNGNNSQYRRFYNIDGSVFTRRNNTNLRLSFNPAKQVELFGGFNLVDRHGADELMPQSNYGPEVLDTLPRLVDYKQSRYTGGIKWDNKRSMVRAFYRATTFDDATEADNDRTGSELNLVASTIVPNYDWILLSGGYIMRNSKLDNLEAELKTHQGWGGARFNFPDQFVVEYRMTYGWAERTSEEDRTVDNIYQLFSIGKNFKRTGGIRAGYEMRTQDDFIQKVTSSGFLFEGWLKPTDKLSFNGMFTTRSEETDEGRRLLGDLDVTRHQFTASYTDPTWGRFKVRWQQRTRENDPLFTEGLTSGIGLTTPEASEVNTKVEYNSLTPELTLRRADLGSLTVTYSLITGSFENVQDSVDYEFRDHVISGTVAPRSVGPLAVDFTATYFSSKRDNDIEKFSIEIGGKYTFIKNHHLDVRYTAINFDDYKTLGGNYTQYYTGNIISVNLIKDLSF
ncbi:MAG: hypothetical protein IPH75_04405 [bacterium]|nr:hypothetical protein [bacterium]